MNDSGPTESHYRRRFGLTVAIALAVLGVLTANAFAASTDRSDLYGITYSGEILHFDKTTGSPTLVNQLPSSIHGLTGTHYGSLAVDQGTFVTTNIPSSGGYPAYFVGSGLTTGDELWIGNVPTFDAIRDDNLYTLAEVPGSSMVGTYWYSPSTVFPVNVDLGKLSTSTPPVATGGIVTSNPSCSGKTPFPYAISYYDPNTVYVAITCGGPAVGLLKIEFQSGSWTKTADLALPGTCTDSSTFNGTGVSIAADPSNAGVIYVVHGHFGAPQYLQKLVVSGSTVTCTTMATFTTSDGYGVDGLTFGPPVADVLSPRQVGAMHGPWEPIRMLLDLNNP